MIVFFAPGRPVTQGSKVAIAYRQKVTGKLRALVKEDTGEALKSWRSVVSARAMEAVGVRVVPFEVKVPVVLWLDFRFVRPRTLVKKRTRHTTRPDLDKLERAVKDAMKGIVYRDDGQVDEVHKRKRFVREGEMEGVVVLAMSPEEAEGVQTTRWPVDPSGVAGPRSPASIGFVQIHNSAIAGDQETPGKG